MPRFYCPEPLEIGLQLKLPESITRHIQVLRLTVPDSITLFNGQGGEFRASLIEITKNLAVVEIKAFFARECELNHSLTLAQGLPEANKMDWIIEKAVELGATAFIPLAASRSVVKLTADRAEKKMRHWQGIMAAAAEQCGRNRLPHLAEPVNFTQWVAQTDLHKRLLLSPRATVSLSDWVRHQPAQALTIMVGPEGGFSEAEEELAIQRGAICVSMGPRVLRTETAGLAALAAIQSLWGEM
jgi:16S rRNA (uracil1498-N3)-methyltransferase